MKRFEVILECHIVRLSEAKKIKTLQTNTFFLERMITKRRYFMTFTQKISTVRCGLSLFRAADLNNVN